MKNSISCVCLDVGGILLRDELVEMYYFHELYKNITCKNSELTIDDFFSYREKKFDSYGNDWVHSYGKKLPKDVWNSIVAKSWSATLKVFPDLLIPYDDSLDFISELSKNYKIYIAANQPQTARSVIEILYKKYLRGIFLDCEISYSKPDIKFFYNFFYKYSIKKEHAIYVGDRVDNDILPLKEINVASILLRRKPDKVFYMQNLKSNFSERYYKSIVKIWHYNKNNTLRYINTNFGNVAYNYSDVISLIESLQQAKCDGIKL